jgi:hypothetical protein
MTVPVPMKITVAGLRNGVVNYGKVKVGRFNKRRFVLANRNRTHTPILFLGGDAHGDPFIVTPGNNSPSNFGFLQTFQVSNCPQPLPANRSCWLDVYFVPQDKITNPKTATLTIYDDADNAPQHFTLTVTAK